MAFWQSILQTCQAWLIERADIGEQWQAGLRKSSVSGARYEMHGKDSACRSLL